MKRSFLVLIATFFSLFSFSSAMAFGKCWYPDPEDRMAITCEEFETSIKMAYSRGAIVTFKNPLTPISLIEVKLFEHYSTNSAEASALLLKSLNNTFKKAANAVSQREYINQPADSISESQEIEHLLDSPNWTPEGWICIDPLSLDTNGKELMASFFPKPINKLCIPYINDLGKIVVLNYNF